MKHLTRLFAAGVFVLAGGMAMAQTTLTTADIKGTQYLDEAYIDGTIVFANNNKTVPLRYNAFKDLIEFKQDGAARVLDASNSIKRVELGTTTFVVEQYETAGKTKYGYFQLIDSGKASLYARKEVKYLPPQKGRALDGSDQPAEFRRQPDTYYLKVGDQALSEVRNPKTLAAMFPDHTDEIAAYIKKHKISARKADDLAELVKYYNSL